MILKIFRAIGRYLTDWKNLAVHAAFGVLLLAIAIFLPVHPLIRVGIMLCVIGLNLLRMKWDKKRKARSVERACESESGN